MCEINIFCLSIQEEMVFKKLLVLQDQFRDSLISSQRGSPV